jgi:glycosyltransferase involved in cell wall biosynthesis
MSGADLLVLPSFYEGFGMQILEAFAMNVPVATSNTSSMPEVAGEAAVYFDPKDISEIKNSIKTVLMDKSLSDRLRQKGKERLKDFSWEKCAKETLETLISN